MSPFDIVHLNVWDPNCVRSLLGYKYYVTSINDFSRCVWIFLIYIEGLF